MDEHETDQVNRVIDEMKANHSAASMPGVVNCLNFTIAQANGGGFFMVANGTMYCRTSLAELMGIAASLGSGHFKQDTGPQPAMQPEDAWRGPPIPPARPQFFDSSKPAVPVLQRARMAVSDALDRMPGRRQTGHFMMLAGIALLGTLAGYLAVGAL